MTRHASPGSGVVLTRHVPQAIYPTAIIVLVALKRSPIDMGGLSQAYRSYDHRASGGRVDKGAESAGAMLFHHSTFRGSSSGDFEVAVEEMRACGRLSLSLRQSLTSEENAKVVENLV